ncbi:MAG: hypothetical protein K0R65_2463 [Crocinitomicaceae bacterium]|jgi:antitoxin component YwqK of YwqJK toxin-antitoxin module|nr:hypothetical protein [Crocinitomicaceae bacterium]
MKQFALYLLLGLGLFVSCTEEAPKKEKELPLIEIKNGMYTEYYPGRKAVKIRGPVDGNELRNGKWALYTENGFELSVTHYIHGKKEGHSIVKYPNGVLNYYGEYRNDQKVGVWRTYDQKGKLVEEKDFGGL